MYKNVGKSIKNIVKAVTWIQILISCLLGIVIHILFASEGRGGMGFLFLLIVIGVGCFTAWLSGLILYAYGEIADGVLTLRNRFCDTEAGIQQTNTSMKVVADTRKTNPAGKKNWTCYSCNTVNADFRAYCTKCGAAHSWSEQKYNEK